MDIYKLKDFEPGSKKLVAEGFSNVEIERKNDRRSDGDGMARNDAEFSDGEFVITSLKQGVKNPGRVNVYANGVFSFSLEVAQVVDLGIKVGMVVDAKKIDELKREDEYGKVYQSALKWVLMRPRSERETLDYLRRKVHEKRIGEESIYRIIQTLKAKKYLNDENFAKWYAENRFVKKGVSRKRLELELIKKGVSREIIDKVVGVRNDEEEIRKIVAKKRAKYDDEKLLAYLCGQGFSYDLVKEVIEEMKG